MYLLGGDLATILFAIWPPLNHKNVTSRSPRSVKHFFDLQKKCTFFKKGENLLPSILKYFAIFAMKSLNVGLRFMT